MRLLALDTATDLCSAALWIDGEVRTREALAPRAHGELILPMVEELLAGASLSLGALDAIAFGRGPGAFTGLRLAAGIAQGLALSAQLPLIPVSDLRAVAAQALAAHALAAPCRALICQDARMEEVYWACFERGGGALRLVGDEAVGAPQTVALPQRWVGTPDVGGIVAAGSGLAAYPLLQIRLAAAASAWLPDLYPRAREIAGLAAEDGLGCAVGPEAALPVYLRDRVTAMAAAAAPPAAPAPAAAPAAPAARN